jgi:hypothetical protein
MRLSLSLTDVMVGSLATWRVTHLLWGEDGPWDCFVRLRALAGDSAAGRALDCFNCLSVAVAIPFACVIANSWLEGAVVWLALSGAAILLDRATTPGTTVAPPVVWRDAPSPSTD